MKKLRAAALAAACGMLALGAQAQSSVQIMGTVDGYVGGIRMAGDPGRRSVVNSGGMTTSWFGFKGTEDLGGGLKANFALTAFMTADTGSLGRFAADNPFSRDANVSLFHPGFGTLTLGRALAPNFLPTILFNPHGDSFTFSPLVLHNNVGLFNGTGWTATTPSDTGWSNEIMYTSPSFGGLTVNAHYQFGEQPNGGPHNTGFNLLYFNGPFAAAAFYERDNVANPVATPFTPGDTKTDWMVAGSYDFGAAKIFGTWGRAKTAQTTIKHKTFSLGASIPAGPGKVLVGAAHTERDPANVKRKTYTVGYDYVMSKSTDVYANVMRDSITGFSSGTSWGVGVRKRF